MMKIEKKPFGKAEGQEVSQYILSNDRMVVKMMTYALGRSLELTDAKEVERITSEFENGDLRLQELVQAVSASEAFRTK